MKMFPFWILQGLVLPNSTAISSLPRNAASAFVILFFLLLCEKLTWHMFKQLLRGCMILLFSLQFIVICE